MLVDSNALRAALGDDAAAALDEMCEQLAAAPDRVDRLFPAAARRTARGDLGLRDAQGRIVLAQDAVRVELYVTAIRSLPHERRETDTSALYRFGDSDEKRAVLLGLGALGEGVVDGSEVLRDALRTNDTRLVGAAMGKQARVLDDEAWRHGVLKCLFTGVSLAEVDDLLERADRELAEMIARYARERVAAGRDVPADVWLVLDRFPDAVGLIGLDDELSSGYADRSDAARRLLEARRARTAAAHAQTVPDKES